MRKTDSAPWYPSTPRPPFTSAPASAVDLSKQNLFSRSFPKHRFEWFCSECACVLFVLSGLLQTKEQTNRSRAGCLLLYDSQAFALRYSAISKGHQLPWLCGVCVGPDLKARHLWRWQSLFMHISVRARLALCMHWNWETFCTRRKIFSILGSRLLWKTFNCN